MTNRILVALDVDSADAAHALADKLRGRVGGFKIGSRLFTSHGPSIVEALVKRGDRVFLDLKVHDIPNTVGGAVAAATRLGIWMVNVHASGGEAMMRAARDAANDESSRLGRPRPLVVAVTVLTSLDDAALRQIGVAATMTEQVERLAVLAQAAGLDGVVASPQEIGRIRLRCGKTFTIGTPWIRAPHDAKGDQRRTMTASYARAAGAKYLVVGRPIFSAGDPRGSPDCVV